MNLSERQIDRLTDIINVGMAQGAGVLNAMLHSKVSIRVSRLQTLSLDSYLSQFSPPGLERLSAVQLGYQGAFSGKALLVFPTPSASKLVTMLTGEAMDSDDFDTIQAGTLNELGNIVINGVLGAVSRLIEQCFAYSAPIYLEDRADHLLCAPERANAYRVLLARTRFSLATDQIEGDLLLLFDVGALDAMARVVGALIPDE